MEINKFNTDVANAMDFVLFNEIPLSLLKNIEITPLKGIKSNEDNNIKKKRISTSI